MTTLAAPRSVTVVRTLWVLGFLVGTGTHVADLLHAGTDVYAGYPAGFRLFWVSLTLLDPLVVLLVLARRRAGVVLAVLVMVSDVAVNLSAAALHGGLGWPGLVAQVGFASLVLVTAPLLWRHCVVR